MMGQTCGKAPPGPEWDADMGMDGGRTLPGTRCSKALGRQARELLAEAAPTSAAFLAATTPTHHTAPTL